MSHADLKAKPSCKQTPISQHEVHQATLQNNSDVANLLLRFGNNLREKRQAVGLSREALADAALLHRTYVGAIERGERNISLASIVKLAAGLGISAGQLVEGL